MKLTLILSLLLLFASCSEKAATNVIQNHLTLSEEGFSFKLMQRERIEIPSDSNNVYCQIDDITKGQTMLQIEEKGEIKFIKSVTGKSNTDFELNGKFYKLECDKLVNKGFGQDYGFFRIIRDSENYREIKDETAEIEKLIQKVAKADIRFIRNGDEHSGKEAADHLRKKWDYADGQVKTVDSFIVNLASKSSMSGKPYKVKLKNGKVMNAEDWFRSLMKSE